MAAAWSVGSSGPVAPPAAAVPAGGGAVGRSLGGSEGSDFQAVELATPRGTVGRTSTGMPSTWSAFGASPAEGAENGLTAAAGTMHPEQPVEGKVRERMELQDQSERLQSKRRWIKAAIAVTWSCIVITAIYAVVTFVVALTDGSSSLLAYSLEAALDVLSSFFVVWRFWGAWGKEYLAPGDRREDQASVCISVFFVVLSTVVIAVATAEVVKRSAPDHAVRIVVLSVLGMSMSIVMGIAKWKVAYETDSTVLNKDAWASFAGALLSLGTLIAGLVYSADSAYWWIDPVMAIVIGSCLFLYGCWGLIVYPWWTREFWRRPRHASQPSTSSAATIDEL